MRTKGRVWSRKLRGSRLDQARRRSESRCEEFWYRGSRERKRKHFWGFFLCAHERGKKKNISFQRRGCAHQCKVCSLRQVMCSFRNFHNKSPQIRQVLVTTTLGRAYPSPGSLYLSPFLKYPSIRAV